MPKATIYTADILNDLPLKEVERLVNQQAERYNKQITRAKQQGLNTGSYFTDLQRAKVHRGGKPPAMKADAYKRQLVRQYKQTETRLKGGVTKGNISKLAKKKEAYAEKYGLSDLSAEQFEQAYELEEATKSKSELFYQHLREGVNRGVLDSYTDFDRSASTEDIMQNIEEQLSGFDKTREPKDSMYSDEDFWASRVRAFKTAQLKEKGKYILK